MHKGEKPERATEGRGRAEREGGLKKDQDDQHRLSDQNQMEEGSGFVMAQLESLIQDPTVIFFGLTWPASRCG
jgi:hypothetical protein